MKQKQEMEDSSAEEIRLAKEEVVVLPLLDNNCLFLYFCVIAVSVIGLFLCSKICCSYCSIPCTCIHLYFVW